MVKNIFKPSSGMLSEPDNPRRLESLINNKFHLVHIVFKIVLHDNVSCK